VLQKEKLNEKREILLHTKEGSQPHDIKFSCSMNKVCEKFVLTKEEALGLLSEFSGVRKMAEEGIAFYEELLLNWKDNTIPFNG